jgi:hypothetical protein
VTKHYARDGSRNMVGVIAPTVPDDLAKAATNLRSKYLLDFPALEVTAFTVHAGGQKTAYVRSATKAATGSEERTWTRTPTIPKALETKAIEDALFDVTSTDVEQFIDKPGPLAQYGLDAPEIRVELEFENKAPGWFEVGQKGGYTYGRRDNDAAVLKLANKGALVLQKFKSEL